MATAFAVLLVLVVIIIGDYKCLAKKKKSVDEGLRHIGLHNVDVIGERLIDEHHQIHDYPKSKSSDDSSDDKHSAKKSDEKYPPEKSTDDKYPAKKSDKHSMDSHSKDSHSKDSHSKDSHGKGSDDKKSDYHDPVYDFTKPVKDDYGAFGGSHEKDSHE